MTEVMSACLPCLGSPGIESDTCEVLFLHGKTLRQGKSEARSLHHRREPRRDSVQRTRRESIPADTGDSKKHHSWLSMESRHDISQRDRQTKPGSLHSKSEAQSRK